MPEQRSFRIERIGLGAQMQRQFRHSIPRHADYTWIVHDQRIRPRSADRAQQRRQITNLHIARKGIAGNINPLSLRMRCFACLVQRIAPKIIRIIAQAHRFCAEIDGVCAKAQRRLQALHISRRGKQFRQGAARSVAHSAVFHKSLYRSTFSLCSSSVFA